MTPLVRINKLLSQLGISSRRKADEMIKQGRISINRNKAAEPGSMINTEQDEIFINGKKIGIKSGIRIYILLNKPVGYITTIRDTHQRRTVMDIVPKGKGLFPVGRLDKDTSGALILTNDGELAHRLMHPSYGVDKIYDVTIAGALKRPDIARLDQGVDIGDGKDSCLKLLKMHKAEGGTKIKVSLCEGRKRQIRRTFIALGYKIKELKRTVYAGIETDIKEGSYRHLSESEILSLKKAVNLL
jgi:23S rRNA pseudouridine2605 synthase